MYKIIRDTIKNNNVCIHRLQDNVFIPFDPANTDYQAYLAWLAEGNQPVPADQ